MMYKNNLAVAIKTNGKVLRETRGPGSEFDDTILIPFGSEYSVFVKNMNSVRALVRIEIDGTDVTDGASVIVPANGSVELERFVKNGNMDAGLKFKFIERTQKIEDGPRGIKAEDGLIRVEFEFETKPVSQSTWCKPSVLGVLRSAKSVSTDVYDSYASIQNASFGSAASDVAYSASSHSLQNEIRSASASVQNLNDKGITVGGSLSEQKFAQGSWFPTDGVKHVMVFKVLGAVGETIVKEPMTVKTKVECRTCGTKSKPGTKFCGECGTGLLEV